MIEITLGPKTFTAKKDAIEYMQALRSRYSVGDRVSAEDQDIILDCLALSPKIWDQKVGCGIDRVMVEPDPHGSQYPLFVLYRCDGTGAAFSYRKCLADVGEVPAVAAAFLNEVIAAHSPIAGHIIVHNGVPFKYLYQTFLRRENTKFKDVEVVEVDRVKWLVDRDLAARWLAFHEEVGSYELVAIKEYNTLYRSDIMC
ncbi:DCL family protein [Bacteroides sp.]|uniref:DCL family protein n=1 Tax=Bacteroides sp. TaxID=29523 RepID=UPI002639AD6F|nr:DCL family protein [Bacteroides sp.]MDD3039028.1 DCL family protein [Bacteroides sp.]